MKYLKVFTDFVEDMGDLGDAERGRLFTAMLEYASTGAVPDLRGNERFLWRTAKKNIDNQRESYETRCEVNAKNGSLGGKRTQANASEVKRNQAKSSDSLEEKDKEEEKEKEKKDNRRFTPPTVEEVRSYCTERGNNVDPQTFVDFYEAKGWMVGSNHMKDWRACVRTWEKNRVDRGRGTDRRGKQNPALNYKQTPISESDFNSLVVNLED